MEQGSRKHSVDAHFPKDPNCEICLKTKITSASCRRRTGTVVPEWDFLGDLLQRITKFSVKKVNRGICRGGIRFGNLVVTILPV